MKKSPRQAETSLRQSEHDPGDIFPERLDNTPSNVHDRRSYFEEALHSPQNSGAPRGYHESYGQHYGLANDFSQSFMASIGFSAEEAASNDPHNPMQVQFAAHSDNSLPRGVDNCAELNSSSCRDGELRRDEPPHMYTMHHRSISAENHSLPPMPSSKHSSVLPQAAGQLYEPFQGRFENSEDAKEYRRNKMRFNREPWRDPANDPTIELVERNRHTNVERIYNAMICGDYARDNPKSTARKRWIEEPHYQSDLVEAYAHKVFDCLLEQVRKGFRGWQQNDYVNDERKGEDEDKDIDCAGRLDNIVVALQQEKCICENVMSSAWQIRMFVNAPKAYSKRKDQNRVGNSKRPNAKGHGVDEDNLRASKRSRTATASRSRQTQGHSSTASEMPLSRGTTPQETFESTGLPYFTTPMTQRTTALSPPPAFLAPQAPSMRPSPRSHHASFDQHNMSASSPLRLSPFTQPHTTLTQSISRITPISPPQRSLFSPPPMPMGRFSASASPDNTKSTNMNTNPRFSPWAHAVQSDAAPSNLYIQTNKIDSSEFPEIEDWQNSVEQFSSHDGSSTANLFAQHPEMGVCLADMELLPAYTVDGVVGENVFEFLQPQDSVQRLPNTPSHRQNRS